MGRMLVKVGFSGEPTTAAADQNLLKCFYLQTEVGRSSDSHFYSFIELGFKIGQRRRGESFCFSHEKQL